MQRFNQLIKVDICFIFDITAYSVKTLQFHFQSTQNFLCFTNKIPGSFHLIPKTAKNSEQHMSYNVIIKGKY